MRDVNPTPDPGLRQPLGAPTRPPAPAPVPLKPVPGSPGIVSDDKGRWQTDPTKPLPPPIIFGSLASTDPDSDAESW